MKYVRRAFVLLAAALPAIAWAQDRSQVPEDVNQRTARVESKVIAWRRDIHRNPELGNREFRTSKLVADHLRSLGLEVKTGIAHTGVVAVLRGGKPGPVVALRADMDALPVTEETPVPFASKVKGTYEGKEVGVAHVCGHDGHTAILMGTAEVLASMRKELPGTVKFIFQPAEEGPPDGEEGGAAMMVRQGALENPRPEVIFGLHLTNGWEVGKIAYRPGPAMASADNLRIVVKGRGTHGARPWAGVDPIVVASQIVLALQTIASRQVDVTREPSVITIGSIHGGNRYNIIPDNVEMAGTIRTYDEAMKRDIHERIRNTADMIAKSAGATAEVKIESPYKVTMNDEKLTARMLPTLRKVAGAENVMLAQKSPAAEDFSFYAETVPGLFFQIGVTPKGSDPRKTANNHSPRFYVDESGLLLGVKALTQLTLDYLQANNK
ncbi:MAG TPA: amidohydrolase [Burkholderiales bacterium]|nr:amidohydrolase [Burkholderiales bacterium]